MRAWNLLVKDTRLVKLIMIGYRDHLRFRKDAKSVKRVHVGDTVMIHNFFGVHYSVEKRVVKKQMVRKGADGTNNKNVPYICIWFD